MDRSPHDISVANRLTRRCSTLWRSLVWESGRLEYRKAPQLKHAVSGGPTAAEQRTIVPCASVISARTCVCLRGEPTDNNAGLEYPRVRRVSLVRNGGSIEVVRKLVFSHLQDTSLGLKTVRVHVRCCFQLFRPRRIARGALTVKFVCKCTEAVKVAASTAGSTRLGESLCRGQKSPVRAKMTPCFLRKYIVLTHALQTGTLHALRFLRRRRVQDLLGKRR